MGEREEVEQGLRLALAAIARELGVPEDEIPLNISAVVRGAVFQAWRLGLRYGWSLGKARETLRGLGPREEPE